MFNALNCQNHIGDGIYKIDDKPYYNDINDYRLNKVKPTIRNMLRCKAG